MMDYENITGFVTCDYDYKWWAGCVVSKEEKKTQALMGHHHYAHILPSKTGHPTGS
jgi:hypothetical protein